MTAGACTCTASTLVGHGGRLIYHHLSAVMVEVDMTSVGVMGVPVMGAMHVILLWESRRIWQRRVWGQGGRSSGVGERRMIRDIHEVVTHEMVVR